MYLYKPESRPDTSFPDIYGRRNVFLPPVANIVPTPKTKKIIGYTIFDADKALAPTNLEINIPSMIVYREKHIIMITVGKVYFINDVNVILFCNVLFI